MRSKLIKSPSIILFLMLIILSSCAYESSTSSGGYHNKLLTPQKIEIDFASLLSLNVLLDDSYVYLNANETKAEFYRSYFNGDTVFLGEVPHFYLRMKHSVLMNSKLYMFVSVFNESTNSTSNDIICIDLLHNELKQYNLYDGSIAGVPVYAFGGDIVTMKNLVTSDQIITFIDKGNLENQDWQRIVEYVYKKTTSTGKAIFGLCTDEENIYYLMDICSSEGIFDTYLKILNKELDEIKSIKIDPSIHDRVMTSMISDMQVCGEYIYIYNSSNVGLLGKIEDDKFIEIFSGNNFELAKNLNLQDAPIFYTRLSNLFYTIDDGMVTKHQINIQNNYSIMTMLSTDKKVFLLCYADDKPNFAYLADRENFEGITFPCQ